MIGSLVISRQQMELEKSWFCTTQVVELKPLKTKDFFRFSTNFYDVITSVVVNDGDTGFIMEVKEAILSYYRNLFGKN